MARRAGPRPHGLTGRALVLGAVVILLVVVLAAPLNRYLTSRSALHEAEHQARTNQRQLTQLQEQLKQWDDPAYIEQQARGRLQYAMPGDTVYVVVRPGQKPSLGGQQESNRAPVRVPGGTWNERLWGSVLTADSAP